jgi:hypothetical protein
MPRQHKNFVLCKWRELQRRSAILEGCCRGEGNPALGFLNLTRLRHIVQEIGPEIAHEGGNLGQTLP